MQLLSLMEELFSKLNLLTPELHAFSKLEGDPGLLTLLFPNFPTLYTLLHCTLLGLIYFERLSQVTSEACTFIVRMKS